MPRAALIALFSASLIVPAALAQRQPGFAPRTGASSGGMPMRGNAAPQFRPMPVAPMQTGNGGQGNFGRGNSGGRGNAGNPGFTGGSVSNQNFSAGSFHANGSGISFNGAFVNDNFKLGVHVGLDPTLLIPHNHGGFHHGGFNHCGDFGHGSCGIGNGWFYPLGWYWPVYYDDSYYHYYDHIYGNYESPDPLLHQTVTPPPAPAPQTEPVRPSTDRELADTYLRAGDPRSAIKSYKAHLKQYPGDEDAMRALGLALLDQGQTAEGVAMFGMAYRAEPLLADRPMSADALRDGDDSIRRALQRTSIYANSAKSASAWLTVAILMQAEGRNDNARAMLARAQAAGLESGLFDRMSAALQQALPDAVILVSTNRGSGS